MERLDETEMYVKPTAVLVLKTENRVFYASLEHNPAAEEFIKMLTSQPLTVNLNSDGFEASGELPQKILQYGGHITAVPGDMVLHRDGRIAVCLTENEGDMALIARIGGREELAKIFGGKTKIELYLEWSE